MQMSLRKLGVLDLVMHLALSRINSPPVRSRVCSNQGKIFVSTILNVFGFTQALRTLGNVIRDSNENRNAFMAKIVETEDGGQKQPVFGSRVITLLVNRDKW